MWRGLASLCPTARGGVRWFVSRPPTPAGILRRGLTAPGPPTRLASLGAGLLRCAGARFALPYGDVAGARFALPYGVGRGLASLCPTARGGVRWFVSRPPTPAGILRRGLTAPGPPTRLASLGAGLLRCAGARFALPYGDVAGARFALPYGDVAGARFALPYGAGRREMVLCPARPPPPESSAGGSPPPDPRRASLRSARACFAAPGLASLALRLKRG